MLYIWGKHYCKSQKSTGACRYSSLLAFKLSFNNGVICFWNTVGFKLSPYRSFLGVTAIFVLEWSVLISINIRQATRVVNDNWEAPNCVDVNGSGIMGTSLNQSSRSFQLLVVRLSWLEYRIIVLMHSSCHKAFPIWWYLFDVDLDAIYELDMQVLKWSFWILLAENEVFPMTLTLAINVQTNSVYNIRCEPITTSRA